MDQRCLAMTNRCHHCAETSCHNRRHSRRKRKGTHKRRQFKPSRWYGDRFVPRGAKGAAVTTHPVPTAPNHSAALALCQATDLALGVDGVRTGMRGSGSLTWARPDQGATPTEIEVAPAIALDSGSDIDWRPRSSSDGSLCGVEDQMVGSFTSRSSRSAMPRGLQAPRTIQESLQCRSDCSHSMSTVLLRDNWSCSLRTAPVVLHRHGRLARHVSARLRFLKKLIPWIVGYPSLTPNRSKSVRVTVRSDSTSALTALPVRSLRMPGLQRSNGHYPPSVRAPRSPALRPSK